MQRINKFIVIFITLIGVKAWAVEQTFTVNNNDTVIAVASKKEITRIVFDNDIGEIEAIAGELQYNVKGKSLYLRTSSEKPVNFFVTTSANHTYKFILEISDIPATQIFVKSTIVRKQKRKNFIYSKQEISEDLSKRISKIINVALKPKRHIGFKIEKLKENLSSIDDITLVKVGQITGKRLTAEKLIITNEAQESYTIKLADFMSEGTLAIYSDKTQLSPAEKGNLIRIEEVL